MHARRRLLCFTGIRGDFAKLHRLLTSELKVATFDREAGEWQWTARYTTVICVGNFLDFFPRPQAADDTTTTTEAIDAETNIVQCFEQLHELAKSSPGCGFLIVVGPHELGNLVASKQHRRYQVRNAGNPAEIAERDVFVARVLRPFVFGMASALVVWGSYFVCSGGFSLHWLKRHNIQSAAGINHLWRSRALSAFMEPDSVIHDRTLVRFPVNWRDYQMFRVTATLAYHLNPKFVITANCVDSCNGIQDADDFGMSLEFVQWKRGSTKVALDPQGEPNIFALANTPSFGVLEVTATLHKDEQNVIFFENRELAIPSSLVSPDKKQ
jgi:hypothetical protein